MLPPPHPVLLLVLLLVTTVPSPCLACDPAQSWLAYAVARGDGRAVTNATISFTVPSLPAKHGGIGSFWWGLEPAPACDLMQPVLALGRMGQGNSNTSSWSIFNERFDWLDSSKSFTTKPKAVAPGARVTSNIHTSGARYRMSIGPVVDYQSKYTYTYMDTEPNKTYSDIYVVVEHQPESCSEMPASGTMVFDQIAIELEGELVTPKWEVLQGSEPRCGCTAEAVDAATVKFTWTPTDADEEDDGRAGVHVLPNEDESAAATATAAAVAAAAAATSCPLAPSPAVTATHDNQVISNLHVRSLSSGAAPAVHVAGFANVTLRNLIVEHSTGGPGIAFSNAPGITIENVSVVLVERPARTYGPLPSDVAVSIVGDGSVGVRIDRVRVRGGSTGVYLLQCPAARLSFVQARNMRGPFPRGQCVQFDKSPHSVLEVGVPPSSPGYQVVNTSHEASHG